MKTIFYVTFLHLVLMAFFGLPVWSSNNQSEMPGTGNHADDIPAGESDSLVGHSDNNGETNSVRLKVTYFANYFSVRIHAIPGCGSEKCMY